MAGNIQLKYDTQTTLACSAASTANQNGRISASTTNTIDLDALMLVKFKESAAAPSGNKQVIIYGLGSIDAGTTVTDGYAFGDANTATLPTTAPVLKGVGNIGNAVQYTTGPFSVAAGFGGSLPSTWGVLIINDTGQAFDAAAGNFTFQYQGVFAQYT